MKRKPSDSLHVATNTPEGEAVRRVLRTDNVASPEKEAEQAVQRIFHRIRESQSRQDERQTI